MNPMIFSVLAGLAFGAFAVAIMIPMEFPDKPAALLGAFASRFAIGFLIPLVHMPLPGWAIGGLVGFIVSLPDAIVTKAYAPVLGFGVVGGLIIGWAAERFVT